MKKIITIEYDTEDMGPNIDPANGTVFDWIVEELSNADIPAAINETDMAEQQP